MHERHYLYYTSAAVDIIPTDISFAFAWEGMRTLLSVPMKHYGISYILELALRYHDLTWGRHNEAKL